MKYILPSRLCYGISLTNAVTFFSHENCTLETLALCKEQQTLLPQTLRQISCKVTGKQLIRLQTTYSTNPVTERKIQYSSFKLYSYYNTILGICQILFTNLIFFGF